MKAIPSVRPAVLSLVFAAALTLVQRSDTLISEWTPKLGERAPKTKQTANPQEPRRDW